MPRFAISLIGMRRAQGSARCLERMIANSESMDRHFYIVSNGCKETADVFKHLKSQHPSNITLSENATNEGFQKPHHRHYVQAAKEGYDFILICNDDISVPPDFLRILSAPMEQDPSIAITGPKGNCGFLNHEFHGTDGKGEEEYIEMSCGMIRIDTMRRLRSELWCPGLRFCYGEDSSLSLFVREKGYHIKTVDMHVDHLRSVTVNGDPETKRLCNESQAANHETNRRRWGHYLRVRNFSFPIVVKRSMALGDVILTTPIVRAIKASNPLSDIHVQTDFPDVFANNPNVTRAAKSIPTMPNELVVDLNGAYEDAPMRHVLEAYEAKTREQVTGLGEVEWRTQLFPSRKDHQWAQAMIAKAEGRPVCLIHGDKSHWPGKDAPQSLWDATASRLRQEGWKVFVVGTTTNEPAFGNDLDLRGQTGILQLAALCAHAKLFAGPDSGPLHISQSMGCPTIGVFGVTSARFLMTHGSKLSPVESPASIPSSGLRHRLTGITHLADGADAMASITPEQVWAGIIRLGIL
jgi:ADP-heptose:LPS heptosyltransferase